MSRLDELAIERLAKQMSYVKIVTASNLHEPNEIARKLFYIVKDTMEEIDREQRQSAMAERKRLNGSGYSGKADH